MRVIVSSVHDFHIPNSQVVIQNIYKLWKKSQLKNETMYSKAFVAQKFIEKRRRRTAKFMQNRLYKHSIITKADKGDAAVIIDVDDYMPSLLLTLMIMSKKPINK